jgi:Na+-translocating ferredoxin:NAD+ oxidoreductase RnfG subunit
LCSRAAGAALALLLALPAGFASAVVYRSQDEALHDAFPDADKIEPRAFVLDPAQVERVQALAEVALERKIWTIHVGLREGQVLGYAVLDLRTVRTMPEALLIVLTPDGAVRSVRVLAFHEPTEYQPTERWLAQLDGKRLGPDLQLKRDIQAIAGATLSSQSVTRAVRTALALYQVLIQPPKPAE